MHKRTDVIYVYDGSFEGLLTSVFESFERKEIPYVIVSESDYVPTLFGDRRIVTDPQKAQRVRAGVKKTAGNKAWNLVRLGYLTSLEDRGALINEFIHMAMTYGEGVSKMLADDTVCRLWKGVKALMDESHKYEGFVRFSVSDNVLTAVIEPKNCVLPLMSAHFCDRYPDESFMIYDRTHSQALIWHKKKKAIISVEDFEEPEASEEEQYFRELWTHFYDTVAIKERENERCRMSFMPKRYWNRLTEMQKSTAGKTLTA